MSIAMFALCVSTAACAQPISITNHSFEANPARPNFWTVGVPYGWVLYDPAFIVDNASDAVGSLNPTNSGFYPAGAPHGSQVALIFLAGDRGGGEVGLRQNLAAVLTPNARYVLRVQVGNIATAIAAPPFNYYFNLDGFPGYAVQLLAGGFVIAEDRDPIGAHIPEGEFRESLVVFDVPAGHPLVGAPLAVRLINLNMVQSAAAPGIEVNFDDVRLSVSPICIGDFDVSGGVDGDDVIAFFAEWDAGALSADVSRDGGVDGDDVIVFFDAWDAGC